MCATEDIVDDTLNPYRWRNFNQARGISAREGARLSSFPDRFSLGVNWQEGARQMGNSVPPLMMRAISGYIRREILNNV